MTGFVEKKAKVDAKTMITKNKNALLAYMLDKERFKFGCKNILYYLGCCIWRKKKIELSKF